ncbi:MAG: hypothetical protein JO286_13075 [Solirubrobacterales bacterium]|nr:hypothetical protein [Solirubrobacterales bacterium]
MLRLPLSAVVIATVLTSHASSNVEPLIIVGVVVSYIVTLLVAPKPDPAEEPVAARAEPVAAGAATTASAG